MPRTQHTEKEKAEMRRMMKEMREVCKDVVIVTAVQHPRPPGYHAPPPTNPNGLVFIDYITLLP
jgi:hypothetical protein